MWRSRVASVVAATFVACGSARYGVSDTGAPTLTLPAHFAEGSNDALDGGAAGHGPGAPPSVSPTTSATSSGGGAAPASVRPAAALPDPVPLLTANQWELSLRYSGGAPHLVSTRSITLAEPVPTARRVGRFAIELWVGKELVERVRFDFPLLAADAPPEGAHRPLRAPLRFAPGADTSQRVLVPASDRATSAVLVDRLTGDSLPIPWPPAVPDPSAVAGPPRPLEPAGGGGAGARP